ncbi:Major facilitator superfamily (MFS) profile domain-containing protein [Entamoeba marina]
MVFLIVKLVFSNFWRYCFCSLSYNFAAFLFWMVVPLCANDLNATNWDLAVINAINFFSRFFFSWFGGPLNNKFPGWFLARVGAFVYIIACVILVFFHDKLWYLWTMGVMYGLSYSLYWIPIQTSISRESKAGNAEFWLGLFSSSWACGQAFGYLAGAFLFSLLGIVEAISISIASLSLVLFFYPCWEGPSVCGFDMQIKKGSKTIDKNDDGYIVINGSDTTNEENNSETNTENSGSSPTVEVAVEPENETTNEENQDNDENEVLTNEPNVKDNSKGIFWVMGKKERKRLRIRTMRYIVPSFVCCTACYGNMLTYGSQYFNRMYGTKDGYFPFMEGQEGRYDMFIGVFFFIIYMMYCFGMTAFAKFKFLFFNRAISNFFLIISIVMNFICGSVSNWITQLVCAVVLGLCGAYSFTNLLTTTSRLSMLTSNISSIYVGLQESITYNLVAFALPLIVGPLSDSVGDYRIPMFGCSILGVVLFAFSEVATALYDFIVIRKCDKKDAQQVVQLYEEIIQNNKASELMTNDNYLIYCREQMLTPKQSKVLYEKLLTIDNDLKE